MAKSKQAAANHAEVRGNYLLKIRQIQEMMGDEGGQCYDFFTNGEECGSNTTWKGCPVLSWEKQGTHFYSLLPIPAGKCPETDPDGTSHMSEQDISSMAPVSLGEDAFYKCFELINKDSVHCISPEESSAHINCFYLEVKGTAFPPYFPPPREVQEIFPGLFIFIPFFITFCFSPHLPTVHRGPSVGEPKSVKCI